MGILNAVLGNAGMANNIGANIAQGAISGSFATNGLAAAAAAAAQQATVMREYPAGGRMRNKTIFSGRVEVQKVVNGYVVNIATREGYEFDTHIAATVKEVNDIISTAIVAFQLEDR